MVNAITMPRKSRVSFFGAITLLLDDFFHRAIIGTCWLGYELVLKLPVYLSWCAHFDIQLGISRLQWLRLIQAVLGYGDGEGTYSSTNTNSCVLSYFKYDRIEKANCVPINITDTGTGMDRT